jgi:histidinol-phosphate aminotransferase
MAGFLKKSKISYIPSKGNFFMMEVARAMTNHKIYIGRVRPIWPTKVRVSVGTQDEMNKFTAALTKVMA